MGLGRVLGCLMKKTEGQKSRDTVPLKMKFMGNSRS
jgi:hypothetical protein